MTTDLMELADHIWIVPLETPTGQYLTAFFCSTCKMTRQHSTKHGLEEGAWLEEHGKHVPAIPG